MLSIVIVNWNTAELLADCLDAIQLAAVSCPLEVTVIDNASNDNSVSMLQRRYSWVNLIINNENVGFAKANNQGINVSTGDYLLLLNSDTLPHDGAFNILIDFMDEHSEAGAAGALLLNRDGTLQTPCYPMMTPFRELWRLLFLDKLYRFATYPLDQWDRMIARPVDTVKGACMLLRRSALVEVGLLDERYFMYSEEVDLCHRLLQAGWGVWYVPGAVITHYGGASSKLIYEKMYLELYRSKVQFFRKTGGRTRAAIYKVLLFFAYLPRVLIRPTYKHYRRLIAALPTL